MAKLLFAATGIESYTVVAGGVGETGAYIDGAYSDIAIDTSGGIAAFTLTDPASAPILAPYSVTAGQTLWLHFREGTNFGFNNGSNGVVVIFDAASHPWFQFAANGNMYYNSGTGDVPGWTQLGATTIGWPGDNRGVADVDISIKIGGDGNHIANFYVNGALQVGPEPFTQALMTGLQTIHIGNNGSGTDIGWSQVLATESLSTVGAHVFTKRGTAAGTHSDWTGTVGDVNEVPYNDGNFNQATAAGLSQSYDMANIALPVGYEIKGIFHWLRGKQDGTAPTNIESLCITGAAVDHTSGNLAGLGAGFGSVGARYDVNPDTGVAWTAADWNVPTQLGFTSAA